MITIRKATTADIPTINALAQIVFPATYAQILSEEQLAYMMEWMYSPANLLKQMDEEGHIYYLAEKDGQAVGYVSIQPETENVFHLQKLYVLPEYQKDHIGTSLFRHAAEAMFRLNGGPCTMRLNVNRNNPALGFYRRMGMKIAFEGDFPIGNGYYMNDYIMELEILGITK